MKARSRKPSKSRAHSHGRTLEQEGGSQRSRSRGDERKKPVGVVPSGYFTRVAAHREDANELTRQEDVMPSGFTNPGLLGDFLDWTVRDLCLSWGDGRRAWFNMHFGLHLHEPWHCSTCHRRGFAACSVSRDRLLEECFCCWSCYIDNGQKDVMKSSWPTMEAFTKHWYKYRRSDRMWDWQAISDELSITPADLVQKITGANFERWPLPSRPEAVRALPKSLPDKQWEDHNERIYGSPWFLERGFTRGYAGCFAPRPPKGPPPRSVLPEPASSQTTKLHFAGRDDPRQQSDGYYRPGASAVAGSFGDRLPVNSAPMVPMRGSVARAAAAYHSPEADTDVEEVYFTSNAGEPLHGTQLPGRCGDQVYPWEKPGYVFAGLIDREVKQWILPYPSISHRTMSSGIAVG